MRLDKLLSNLKYGSRNDIKKIIKDKHVKVNNEIIKDPSYQVDTNVDVVSIYDEVISYKENIYLMLNKPKDYISATYDNLHKTVIDLLDEEVKVYDIFPCGRLDIDTEGLLILSNDGQFGHRIMHPKKEIYKKYYVELDSVIDENDVKLFKKGLEILDGNDELYVSKPGLLEIIDDKKAYVYICEGKFHQVKRMFQKVGKKVMYLKRVSIGKLYLDETLKLGEYRELTDKEKTLLFENDNIFSLEE